MQSLEHVKPFLEEKQGLGKVACAAMYDVKHAWHEQCERHRSSDEIFRHTSQSTV